MNRDPNITRVRKAAKELGPLVDRLVLVGGSAVGFLITDGGAAPVRPTIDVDVVVELTPTTAYYEFCDQLRAQGFREGADVICRWVKDDIILDVMPVDDSILGFSNRWYSDACRYAQKRSIDEHTDIMIITAPYFIATKLDSFISRAQGNYLHHDMEDIVNVIDGRLSICDEIDDSDGDLKAFLRDEFEALLGDESFTDQVSGHLAPADAHKRRDLLIGKMRRIAGL